MRRVSFVRTPNRTVILISGLSIRRASSFSRQLRLLARGLSERGWDAVLAGRNPLTEDILESRECHEYPALSTGRIHGLLQRYEPRALVLLGYPDQFPFLERPWDAPVYLWAQFSSPPKDARLAHATLVPLTETTRAVLAAAGVDRMGPTIPHGVDTSLFCPRKVAKTAPLAANAPADAFTVGTVGANTTRKRFDALIRGFALFQRRHPEARLLIKTDRRSHSGGFDLDGLARSAGIPRGFRIVTGDLPAETLASFYASLDVYVHTAEWEGFGLPPVEAMSCGIPVATTPIQGPGETVPYRDYFIEPCRLAREGETVLRGAEPKAVAEAMEAACTDPRRRRILGRSGRREARRRYDYRKVARRWEVLISRRPGVP